MLNRTYRCCIMMKTNESNKTRGCQNCSLEQHLAATSAGSKMTVFIVLAITVMMLASTPGCLESNNTPSTTNTDSGPTILKLNGSTIMNFTMADLMALPAITASGEFKKSTGTIMGPYTYTGVNLSALVSKVFSGGNYSIKAEASDGYNMTYSSSQVDGSFAVYDSGGNVTYRNDLTLLLAYHQDGVPISNANGGPIRVVIVGQNSPITDGHLWSKYVCSLTVTPYVLDWTLNLTGVKSMSMDRQTFEGLASCEFHKTFYNFTNSTGNHMYEGIPLWVIVAAVDGADAPDGHYLFNSLLADIGYNVTVIASDGYNISFNSTQVARNNSIIVAYKLDGVPLPDSEFPVRIVGDNLTGSQKVKKIAQIRLDGIPIVPVWNLTLAGANTQVFDSATFAALYNCGVHTKYYNYTSNNASYSYGGVPLWVLIGAVDDNETSHNTLNAALVSQGYNVTITAADGYNTTLPISTVANNDSIIVAYTLNGTALAGSDAPLKLVGPYLAGSQKVTCIIRIELVGL